MQNFLILLAMLVVFEMDSKGKIYPIYTQMETSKATCEKEVYIERGDYASWVMRKNGQYGKKGGWWLFQNGEQQISGVEYFDSIGFWCLEVSLKDAKVEKW